MTRTPVIDVVPADTAPSGTWERVVDENPAATPFHTLAWREAIRTAFGYEPRYRLFLRDGRPVGAFPAFKTPNVLGADLTQPFCEYGYPLVDDNIDLGSVLGNLTADRGFLDALVIKESRQSGNVGYRRAGFGGVRTGVTFRLRLDRSFDQIRRDSFGGEATRNLDAAQASDLDVRPISATDEYYALYRRSMQRLGSPPFPRSFFPALDASFGDACTFLGAELDGTPVAGLLTLSTDEETVIWGNASDPAYWDRSPNHLLYASAIERAVERDRSVVDFGRTRPGSGTARFKRQFGGREYPLVSMVSPPHRLGRASVERYRSLEPVGNWLSPVVTHERVGHRLKAYLHE